MSYRRKSDLTSTNDVEDKNMSLYFAIRKLGSNIQRSDCLPDSGGDKRIRSYRKPIEQKMPEGSKDEIISQPALTSRNSAKEISRANGKTNSVAAGMTRPRSSERLADIKANRRVRIAATPTGEDSERKSPKPKRQRAKSERISGFASAVTEISFDESGKSDSTKRPDPPAVQQERAFVGVRRFKNLQSNHMGFTKRPKGQHIVLVSGKEPRSERMSEVDDSSAEYHAESSKYHHHATTYRQERDSPGSGPNPFLNTADGEEPSVPHTEAFEIVWKYMLYSCSNYAEVLII
jgi:hypothetical protein